MRVVVNIDVPDLQAAIAFYTAALGLRHSRTLDDDVAELVGASSVIYLLQNAPGSSPGAAIPTARDYGRHWTPVHMDFVVEDLAAAVERALAAGAIQQGDLVDWKGSRCITFADPFGHGFCLIAFEGDSYRA
jgi:predicted enzyme related to lactoylglutathione lyase